MFRASTLSTADLPPPSARRVPRSCRGDGWDALADIEVFVFAVEAEREAMDRERVGVHRRGRKPPANADDRAGTLPTLPRLAALGFQGHLLGDSGFKGTAPFRPAEPLPAAQHRIRPRARPLCAHIWIAMISIISLRPPKKTKPHLI
jgi:hypothetical protein